MSVADELAPICYISTGTVPNRGNSRAEEILRVCTSQEQREAAQGKLLGLLEETCKRVEAERAT